MFNYPGGGSETAFSDSFDHPGRGGGTTSIATFDYPGGGSGSAFSGSFDRPGRGSGTTLIATLDYYGEEWDRIDSNVRSPWGRESDRIDCNVGLPWGGSGTTCFTTFKLLGRLADCGVTSG
eukprot:CAMPEP_0202456302 /NCGR_PEP_ID=MMETSP1360-20130828/13596_1 /ASSEMBLY_ACC=CAM_ASM_000848 /TAXON_ID=515479 /ORGANISM="Licmophora paradoxa, Strain CCMP2313" /LENGTH=120 /DNA_ID=CAMNT_0049076067 /DNA_START=851 /DNA_END=1214 /DNA_ORIENTATION=-